MQPLWRQSCLLCALTIVAHKRIQSKKRKKLYGSKNKQSLSSKKEGAPETYPMGNWETNGQTPDIGQNTCLHGMRPSPTRYTKHDIRNMTYKITNNKQQQTTISPDTPRT